MQETWVPSLGQEDLLEKGMATHSSVLAWRILWTEEPRGLQSMESDITEHTHTHSILNTLTYMFFDNVESLFCCIILLSVPNES